MPCTDASVPTEFQHLAKRHPCFSGEAHLKAGRLHIPLASACNIQCRFCRRDRNEDEIRPGVTRGIVAPENAGALVDRALGLCPDLSVIGCAGPGDTLAGDQALTALAEIHALHPELIICMSTNGLNLPEKIEAVKAAGVSTLTVTVNGLSPDVVSQVVEYVSLHGKRYEGVEAARILTANQLQGIRLASEAGMLVKVNMVFIPSVNGHEVGAVAQAVKEAGASLFNLIPLIPQGDFSGLEAPSCAELNAAREEAERYLPVFRHCQHCRADACGIPGKTDFSKELYAEGERVPDTFSHG